MPRVLVIDDEPELVDMMTTVLAESGYDVIAAHHGADGLMLFEVERPDVVVVDINMPGLSGTEVLQQIRLRRPELPVIVISGYVDDATALRCLNRGAVEFIRKPFQLEQFNLSVASALSRS